MRKKVCIGDLGTIVTGNTPPRNRPELYGNHTPFIKATDISESEKYTYNPEECYSEEGYNKYIKSLIPKGSTCVVTIGSIGKKMTMAHCDLFINQAMNAIIPNACFDSEYVYYAVKNVLGNIKTLDSGTASGRENVSKSAFSKMEIWIEEELPIQQRIATILSRYDSLIENYQKQIKLLEESTQRLYKEWFIDLRFPGHENTKIVDGVPEGWEKKKIKDLVDLKSGYAFKSSAFVEKGKYKIVTIKNVKDGVFDGDNVSYLNSVPEKMPSHCILQTGDILLSLTGNVGRICMVVGDNYLLNQRVAKLESKFPAFTYCLFRHYDTFVAINNLANGAAQQNVSPIRIGEMDMLVANDKFMYHFEKEAENIRTNILNLYSQIRHLTEARDRLLPKPMSGEIEV
jgi:type I restriction enzyme S subunit